MQLDKFNTANSVGIDWLPENNIDINHFLKITEIIKNTFKKLKINPEGKNIYYQRYQNGTSVLAIQVTKGEQNDIRNYMFNGCDVEYLNDYLSCNVYLHAEAKSSQISANIAGLMTKDIVEFFENLEKNLQKNNLTNIELSLKIALSENNVKQEEQNKSKIKRLVKSIFTKR